MASNVINFKNDTSNMSVEKKVTSIGMQQDIENAVLRTCEHNELPDYASNNMLIYTRDTGQIFAGRGKGMSLLDMSDVIVINNFDYLPSVGVPNKLYISKEDSCFVYFDAEKQSYTHLSLNNIDQSIVGKKGVVEYDLPNDFPIDGESEKLYLTKDNKLYRWSCKERKYSLVSDQASFEKMFKSISNLGDLNNILNVIGDLQKFKADKVDLDAYRKRADKISLVDLANDVINAMNIGGGSDTSSYDDTELRQKIQDLEADKANSKDLLNYRSNTTPIKESDLSADLQHKIGYTYDDTAINKEISSLKSSKLDTNIANSTFRKNTDLIKLSDLDQEVLDKFNNSGDGSGYDDTQIRQELNDKADIADLDNYRSKDTAIDIADLAENLKNLINDAATPELFDDSLLIAEDQRLEDCKLDKSVFEAYQIANDTNIQNIMTNLNSAISDILQLKQELAQALDRIAALENASSGDTPPPEPTVNSFSYTFALPSLGYTFDVADLPGYDASKPITLNDFYGISDNDETYNPELQKVVIKFMGYAVDGTDSVTITNPANPPYGTVIPVSIQGVDTSDYNVYPDGAADYDSDSGIISFEHGSLGRRVYVICTKDIADTITNQ